jgi:hypothetical protein
LVTRITQQQRNAPTPSPEELVRTFFESVEGKTTQRIPSFALHQRPHGTSYKVTIKARRRSLQQANENPPARISIRKTPTVIRKSDKRGLSYTVSKLSMELYRRNWKVAEDKKIGTRKNVKNHKTGSNVAKHAWTYDHRIDFENAEVIDKGNFRTRRTLESWHTALTTDADNNSCPLPGQYTVLIKKQS